MTLCLVIVLSGFAACADTLPSSEKLISAAVAARAAQKDWKYTYREDDEWFLVPDKDARRAPSERKTFDVIMLEGEPYRKLVLVNGRPLDAEAQAQVDQDLERERTERRRQRKAPTVIKLFKFSLPGIEKLEGFFDNKVMGEETVAGRKTWRVESIPKHNRRPANQEEEMTANTRCTTWIDQQDSVEIKQTSIFVRPYQEVGAGTDVKLEFSKFGEAWLPETVRLRMHFKVGPMQHPYREQHVRYSNYKRFIVDSEFRTP